MKADIHPKYFLTTEIRCSCGNVIIVGSTKEKLKTELCSKCHPFYTGQQKLVDTAGRVDKFQEKRKKSAQMHEATAKAAEAKKKKPDAYIEKEVSPEILAKVMAVEEKQTKSKWGAPLGDSPAQEVVKEEIAEAKAAKAKKKAVKKVAKKAPAKKPLAKKKAVKAIKKAPAKKSVKKGKK